MVPRDGYTQKAQRKQKNTLIGVPALIAKWCAARLRGFIQFFKDFGSEDAERKLVFELVVLTDKDEMAWEALNESIEAFEASQNNIPFRLEVTLSGPILFTRHAEIKSRIVKGTALDLLVEAVFKQEARNHRRDEIRNFDPDEEFKKVLLPRYREFVKGRPK